MRELWREMEMTSSCDLVDSALENLHSQLQDEHVRFGSKYPGQLTVQESKKMKPLNDMTLHVMNLSNEWGFLRTFLDYIHRWVVAEKVVQNLGSLVIKPGISRQKRRIWSSQGADGSGNLSCK